MNENNETNYDRQQDVIHKPIDQWEPRPQPTCRICGEPMPPGEEMFKFHGYSGTCPKPPLPKPQERTIDNAINEADRLLEETLNELDPDNKRDGWFMVRITKIREALEDRPARGA